MKMYMVLVNANNDRCFLGLYDSKEKANQRLDNHIYKKGLNNESYERMKNKYYTILEVEKNADVLDIIK